MEDLLETPEDYGCYIVDRRGQGVEESVNELVSFLSFLPPLFYSPYHRHAPSMLPPPLTTPTLGLRPRTVLWPVLMIDQPTPLFRQQVPTTTYQPAKPN
jgi:hypothetical protein